MQVRVVGRASSRPSGIGSPHTSHTPYVPSRTRAPRRRSPRGGAPPAGSARPPARARRRSSAPRGRARRPRSSTPSPRRSRRTRSAALRAGHSSGPGRPRAGPRHPCPDSPTSQPPPTGDGSDRLRDQRLAAQPVLVGKPATAHHVQQHEQRRARRPHAPQRPTAGVGCSAPASSIAERESASWARIGVARCWMLAILAITGSSSASTQTAVRAQRARDPPRDDRVLLADLGAVQHLLAEVVVDGGVGAAPGGAGEADGGGDRAASGGSAARGWRR